MTPLATALYKILCDLSATAELDNEQVWEIAAAVADRFENIGWHRNRLGSYQPDYRLRSEP